MMPTGAAGSGLVRHAHGRMSDPNDEAISGHRLYGSGLSEVLWAGVIRDSDTVRALEKQNRVTRATIRRAAMT
jgi:hypothetical protein